MIIYIFRCCNITLWQINNKVTWLTCDADYFGLPTRRCHGASSLLSASENVSQGRSSTEGSRNRVSRNVCRGLDSLLRAQIALPPMIFYQPQCIAKYNQLIYLLLVIFTSMHHFAAFNNASREYNIIIHLNGWDLCRLLNIFLCTLNYFHGSDVNTKLSKRVWRKQQTNHQCRCCASRSPADCGLSKRGSKGW